MNTLHYIFIMTILAAGLMPVSSAEPVPFNTSIGGDRNLNQPFTFTMDNVSGTYASSVYQYTVYDYRIIDGHYNYYSVNWGDWFKFYADPGNKYLIVWVRGNMEGGTSYFGWGQDRFRAWIGNQVSKAEPVLLQDIPIRNPRASRGIITEQERTGPVCGNVQQQDTEPIEYNYAGNPLSSQRQLPVVILETENLKARNERGQLTTERYGWKDEHELDRHEPGTTWDGFMLFQIPHDAKLEDIQIAGWFRNYGTAVWNLVDREIDQDSVERYHSSEVVLLELEREIGLRLPDKADEDGRTEA